MTELRVPGLRRISNRRRTGADTVRLLLAQLDVPVQSVPVAVRQRSTLVLDERVGVVPLAAVCRGGVADEHDQHHEFHRLEVLGFFWETVGCDTGAF